MIENQTSYRQIFKATSLFGGIQVFNVIFGIIRTKFVAILLGTTGVGIMGLLNAPIQLIIAITGLGISYSAVRDVSEANSSGDQTRIARTILMLRRWAWFTGILGAVVTVTMAPLLSQWSFGNTDYTWAFIWLSVTLILRSITSGQSALLQGTRRLNALAKSSVIGSFLGLITSIPLYYYYGIRGIVPAMIITAVTSLYLTWYFARKVPIVNTDQSVKESVFAGIGMAKLGIFMTLTGFIGSACEYILKAYISNSGGVEQIGLYNAGWGVVAQYTGLIFAAMSTDYFPRLSAVNQDTQKVNLLVKQQAEIALFILIPLLSLLIITMPLVIKLFYTSAFIPIVLFANLTVLGMPLKTVSWSMGYIYLAKGNGRLFFKIEFILGLLVLFINLLGYHFFGLVGLGYSFIITYIIGNLVTYPILKRKYTFKFPMSFLRTFSLVYFFCIASFLTSLVDDTAIRLGSGIIIFILASFYSLYRLNKVMDLKSVISNVFLRFRNLMGKRS